MPARAWALGEPWPAYPRRELGITFFVGFDGVVNSEPPRAATTTGRQGGHFARSNGRRPC